MSYIEDLYSETMKNNNTTFRMLELYVNETPSDAMAQFYLGHCLLLGKGTEIDNKRAFELLEKSAKADQVNAIFKLAEMHINGTGREVDITAGMEWLLKAAKKQNFVAVARLEQLAKDNPTNTKIINALAECAEKGYGCAVNFGRAAKEYTTSAELGDASANYKMGQLYEKGQGVKASLSEAANWYFNAAKAGSKEAFARLESLEKDKSPNSHALVILGKCYEEGAGVEKDLAKAESLYRNAATLKNASAMLKLGRFKRDGIGCAVNMKEARVWFYKAAEEDSKFALEKLEELAKVEGPEQAAFFNEVGRCYGEGHGTARDAKKACEFYQKGADLGYDYSLSNLSGHYYYGTGVDKNIPKAVDLCYQAAVCCRAEGPTQRVISNLLAWSSQGTNVNYELGSIDFNGYAKQSNISRGISLLQTATDDERAICLLGIAHQLGKGVPKNSKLAAEKFLIAAKKNKTRAEGSPLAVQHLEEMAKDLMPEPLAMHNAALCFEEGWGTKADPVKAAYYYKLEIDEIFQRILQYRIKAMDIPANFLSTQKLTKNLFSNDIKALDCRRGELLRLTTPADAEREKQLADITLLISSLQNIINYPLAARSLMTDATLLAALEKDQTNVEAKHLKDYFQQLQTIDKYTAALGSLLLFLKDSIDEKERNHEWKKKAFGIFPQKKMPEGIELIYNKLENINKCDAMGLLKLYGEIIPEFATRQTKKGVRYPLSDEFYKAMWEEVILNFDFKADVNKLAQKFKTRMGASSSTAAIQQVLMAPPLPSYIPTPSAPPLERSAPVAEKTSYIAEWLQDKLAKPVKPITAPIGADFMQMGVPQTQVAHPYLPDVLPEPLPSQRYVPPVAYPPQYVLYPAVPTAPLANVIEHKADERNVYAMTA